MIWKVTELFSVHNTVRFDIHCSFVFFSYNAPLVAIFSQVRMFFYTGNQQKKTRPQNLDKKKNYKIFNFLPFSANFDRFSKSVDMTRVSAGITPNNIGSDTPKHCSSPWKNKKMGVFWGSISFIPIFGQVWGKKWEFVALLFFFRATTAL